MRIGTLRLVMVALLALFWSAVARAEIDGTVTGSMRMYLYEGGTELTDSPNQTIYCSLGDTIPVVVWLKNLTQEKITTLSLYFTVDDRYFDLVPLARYSDGNFQPFEKGNFMEPANPQTFSPNGNYTFGDKHSASDNGIAGWQMDFIQYASGGQGTPQLYSNYPENEACRFYLIAKGVCDSATVTLDDDHSNGRFARYNVKDSNDSHTFRRYYPLYITVSGARIEPPIPDLLMAPTSSDSTSLDLDDHIVAGSIPDSVFSWKATGNTRIGVTINPSTHKVKFTAPAGFRGYEDITFTVYDNTDPSLATDTMRVTVGVRPVLKLTAIPDTIIVHEDSLEAVLNLPDIVTDSDNTFENLTWTFTTKGHTTPQKVSSALFLKGALNYFGPDSLTIKVRDDLGLTDSLTVPIVVLPVNDPPLLNLPAEVEFERTKSFAFPMMTYASDPDVDQLTITYTTPQHFLIQLNGMTVIVTETAGFIGEETLHFTVTDPSGATASDTLRISVVPLKGKPVWNKLPKVGFPQGGSGNDLVIWNYVSDPDGPDNELTFTFSGNNDVDSLSVNPLDGRLYLADTNNTPGWDFITVTATDTDDNSASTQFLAFVGPSDGTPIVAAIPDTTIRAGRVTDWIDLDDYYYDVNNTDGQMKWTWAHTTSDSVAYVTIHSLFRTVKLSTYTPDSTGVDEVRFTVTDPGGKKASDVCIIRVLGETKPLLDMPAKIGFVMGTKEGLNLDDYADDTEFGKSDLTWSWHGNSQVAIAYDTADTVNTRPVKISGATGWTGWEKVHFEVRNPLGGNATDSTIVFSVPADGSPVAGGLTYVRLTAGSCDSLNIDLDDYYFDADTMDWNVSWSVAGNDSIIVSIDAVSHRVQFCSPSPSFEGSEVITFIVSDGVHTSSMQTTVAVGGAVIRNIFSLMVFRNPMQGDYMDLYVQSSKQLFASPTLTVAVETDTTMVTMKSMADTSAFYHGSYLLPYVASLGVQRTARVIARGMTKTGKAVEDTLGFAYGRLGASGGKLAVGAVKLAIPAGALTVPTTITVVPSHPEETSTAKAAGEVRFTGDTYSIGPATLTLSQPADLSLTLCCRPEGAGVYRSTPEGWVFAGALRNDQTVTAAITQGGSYRVGYDRTAPVVALVGTIPGGVRFSVVDLGSGIDRESLQVTVDGISIPCTFDEASGLFTASLNGQDDHSRVTLDIRATDRSGNSTITQIEADHSPGPGVFTVEQNTPNPFNPSTTIMFSLSSEARVRVEIYDILGRLVATLADDRFEAGTHRMVWNAIDDRGRQVASGTYLYRVTTPTQQITKRMLFLR